MNESKRGSVENLSHLGSKEQKVSKGVTALPSKSFAHWSKVSVIRSWKLT